MSYGQKFVQLAKAETELINGAEVPTLLAIVAMHPNSNPKKLEKIAVELRGSGNADRLRNIKNYYFTVLKSPHTAHKKIKLLGEMLSRNTFRKETRNPLVTFLNRHSHEMTKEEYNFLSHLIENIPTYFWVKQEEAYSTPIPIIPAHNQENVETSETSYNSLPYEKQGHINALLDLVQEQLSNYHSGNNPFRTKNPDSKIKELMVVKALSSLGLHPHWEEDSHKSGTDVWSGNWLGSGLNGSFDVSIKSGTASEAVVKISSHRNTRKQLNEILQHIKDYASNLYVCIAQDPKQNNLDPFSVNYVLVVFEKESIDLGDVSNWEQKGSNWFLNEPTGAVKNAEIKDSLNNQLWFDIDYTHPDFRGATRNLTIKLPPRNW